MNITRWEAKEQGLVHYFTGRPCKHGHTTNRYVSSGRCAECDRLRGQRHADKVLIASKRWNNRNKDRMDEYRKDFYSNPDRKQSFLNKCKEYRQTHKSKYAAHCRTRQARKLNATPSWLSELDTQHIETMYEHAQRLTIETGTAYVVDHIVPLQGINVCGLHVPWNLNVITAQANASKHNKLTETNIGRY